MLRAFIAIELSAELQKAISQVLERLQAKAGKSTVRWVSPANIHLTVKFLGEVAPNGVALIEEALTAEAAFHTGFWLEANGLGAFPNTRKPRVIWIGVDMPSELASLQHGIDSATARLGYPSESRPFSPHLTLGRVRENASVSELASISSALKEIHFTSPGPFVISSVHLYKSDLQPSGSVYTRLFSAPLANSKVKE